MRSASGMYVCGAMLQRASQLQRLTSAFVTPGRTGLGQFQSYAAMRPGINMDGLFLAGLMPWPNHLFPKLWSLIAAHPRWRTMSR